jgi:hydroxymethylpyrimidine/phosphomethylpyrimidine kinase
MQGRVLIIATSDSSGGAGINADIKTVTALNAYAMTAIAALTAQSTEGVFGIVDVDPDFLYLQIKLCAKDIGVDAVKIGMLHKAANFSKTAQALRKYAPNAPVILDPVMISKSGAKLLEEQAVENLKKELMPLTTLLTPNIPEAEALSGLAIKTHEDAKQAAKKLHSMGPRAVLLKGGHSEGDQVTDILFDGQDFQEFKKPRLQSHHTHGTGCTLSSAIATGLAQGLTLAKAVQMAQDYVFEAIRTAPGLGKGHGPLNHSHTVKKA